jgi:predicted RNA-binding protein with PUA-like domain
MRPSDHARLTSDWEERSMAKHWLFKTEPSTYSFAQLRAEGRATWDGVKNPLALKHLANVAEGDLVFIYHTGDEKAVVGVARAASGAYPDPKAKDAKLLVVDLTPVRLLGAPVSLAAIKASKRFAGFDLVRLPRLSVMPVSEEQAAEIERMAKAR